MPSVAIHEEQIICSQTWIYSTFFGFYELGNIDWRCGVE